MRAIEAPFQLMPLFQPRVWGSRDLGPWYVADPTAQDPIGEVWFSSLGNPTSLGPTLGELVSDDSSFLGQGRCEELPLLVKFLFTEENLSVQVHPDDAVAAEKHGCPGKTECWHVMRARPGAAVAWGFTGLPSESEVRGAALDGSLAEMLYWRPVSAGETVFTPAGTVHAIGSGVVICEVQQNSDITYRLFDYGRGRELHLEDGLAVSDLGPATAESRGRELAAGRDLLVECPKFCLERLTHGTGSFVAARDWYHLWIQTDGESRVGNSTVANGEVWLVPAGGAALDFDLNGTALVTYAHPSPTPFVNWQKK